MTHQNQDIQTFGVDADENLELLLMTEVIGLKSLHYGYFHQTPDNIELGDIRKAQIDYTHTLAELIPPEVKSILDVGSGIGDNARYLVAQGHQVTAISPDINHRVHYETLPNGLEFYSSTIQDFVSDHQFDLMLMSESQGYFPPEDGFSKAKLLLRPSGYLLVSGHWKVNHTDEYSYMEYEQAYIDQAKEFGLDLIQRIDITDNVLPTMTYIHGLLVNNLMGLARFIDSYSRKFMPNRTKLAKFFLKGQIPRMENIFSYYERFCHPKNFKENASYTRLLFQLSE